MSVYFDQAAAARPDPEVLAYYGEMVRLHYANQEATHSLGYELRRKLDRAAAELSTALTGHDGCRVIWGMNGTELFNLFADSPVAAGKRVLTSRLEHPALLAALQRSAAEVRFIPAGNDGRLKPSGVDSADIDLAAFHQIQSELGVCQNTAALFAASPGAVRFVDAIQSAGKLEFPADFDVAAVSGHKFGAPGGAALLLAPEFSGAEKLVAFARDYRHRFYRIGRPEPPVLLTLAFAAKLRRSTLETTCRRISELNHFLREALCRLELPGGGHPVCTIPEEAASPYILHLTLPGLQSAVVVRMLAEAGVMTAAGSACSAESREPSTALRAIGFRPADAYSGLRIGLGSDSTAEEAKKLVEALGTVLKNY